MEITFFYKKVFYINFPGLQKIDNFLFFILFYFKKSKSPLNLGILFYKVPKKFIIAALLLKN